jgi:hypothetical protein
VTAEPTGVDRERAVAIVRGAVDDGRIDLQEAERLLSTAHQARTRRELDDLVGTLAPQRPTRDGSDDRAVYLRAAVRIVLFATAAALLLMAVLHGIDPLDPH